jgi:hypothetical protein
MGFNSVSKGLKILLPLAAKKLIPVSSILVERCYVISTRANFSKITGKPSIVHAQDSTLHQNLDHKSTCYYLHLKYGVSCTIEYLQHSAFHIFAYIQKFYLLQFKSVPKHAPCQFTLFEFYLISIKSNGYRVDTFGIELNLFAFWVSNLGYRTSQENIT